MSRVLTSAGGEVSSARRLKREEEKQLLSREFDSLQGRRVFINKGPVSHALLPVLLLPALSLRFDTHTHQCTHSWAHTDTLVDTPS